MGSSSISLEESRTSSGETWFQPRFVYWNGGTDSRCFRMRLCEMEHVVEGVTLERLSEIGYKLTLGVSAWPWPGWFGSSVLPIAPLHRRQHQWHS